MNQVIWSGDIVGVLRYRNQAEYLRLLAVAAFPYWATILMLLAEILDGMALGASTGGHLTDGNSHKPQSPPTPGMGW